VSGPPRIRLARPDGSGDHPLAATISAGDQFHPDWSHDGARIAFSADDGDGTRDIWVSDVDGAAPRKVFDCSTPCKWSDDPAWAPDDGSLLVQVGTAIGDGPDGRGELILVDLADASPRTVLASSAGDYFYVPRWGPSGRVVVELARFATTRLDDEQAVGGTIGIIDTRAPVPAFVPLLPMTSRASYPDWQPGGGLLVYQAPVSRAAGEEADIHVIATDATGDRTITAFGQSGGWGIQPSWTPDGKQIIFVGEDTVRTHAMAAFVGPDGSGLVRVTDAYFRTHPRLRPTP
jgi:Tol biopolymer transport system component